MTDEVAVKAREAVVGLGLDPVTVEFGEVIDRVFRPLLAEKNAKIAGLNAGLMDYRQEWALWCEKWKHTLDREAATVERLVAAERHLGNLLAVLLGDGGHYQVEHGTDKAVKDALERYYKRLTDHDQALYESKQEVERLTRMHKEAFDIAYGHQQAREEAQSALHAITRALIAADPEGESDETDLGRLALEGIAKLIEQRDEAEAENGKLHHQALEDRQEMLRHVQLRDEDARQLITERSAALRSWRLAERERDAALERVRELEERADPKHPRSGITYFT